MSGDITGLESLDGGCWECQKSHLRAVVSNEEEKILVYYGKRDPNLENFIIKRCWNGWCPCLFMVLQKQFTPITSNGLVTTLEFDSEELQWRSSNCCFTSPVNWLWNARGLQDLNLSRDHLLFITRQNTVSNSNVGQFQTFPKLSN